MATWTESRDQRLKTLWGQGLTTSEIAKDLGGFDHCEDSGRNAVIGRVKRHRDAAKTQEELAFWTRTRGSEPSGTVRTPRVRTARAARPAAARPALASVEAQAKPAEPVTHEEKLALIDTVEVPAIVVTDEEVAEAFKERMLSGKTDVESFISWSTTRFSSTRAERPPICTEPMPGMVPCGKPAVPRTARCEGHGGLRICGIKHTGYLPGHTSLNPAE